MVKSATLKSRFLKTIGWPKSLGFLYHLMDKPEQIFWSTLYKLYAKEDCYQETQPPWKLRVSSDQSDLQFSEKKKKISGCAKGLGNSRLWGDTVVLESPLLCAIMYFYAWVKFNKRKCWKHARWITVCVSATAHGTCFTMLTESNETVHSRKVRWGMGDGRQGHRDKDVKGKHIGTLFKKLIPMNQHRPRWMHVHLTHKKETPRGAPCFECRGKPVHPVCYYKRFIGKKRRKPRG